MFSFFFFLKTFFLRWKNKLLSLNRSRVYLFFSTFDCKFVNNEHAGCGKARNFAPRVPVFLKLSVHEKTGSTNFNIKINK